MRVDRITATDANAITKLSRLFSYAIFTSEVVFATSLRKTH